MGSKCEEKNDLSFTIQNNCLFLLFCNFVSVIFLPSFIAAEFDIFT